jgi:isopropylmalate/homocitrate/citramalate synthase
MAGAEEVVRGLTPSETTEFAGLVLNERGYERFRETALDRINVTFAATESFNQANGGMSLEAAVAQADAILSQVRGAVPRTVTISVCFGCPFEGDVDPGRVAELAERFAGRAEVVLADTIGVATPSKVRSLVERAHADGFHGHNTRNTGYVNCLAALEGGATTLDASIGGLGGCPYAPRATGNVATEDLVYLLAGEGIDTGVDLDALIRISQWLEGLLGRQLEGYVYRAGSQASTLP